MSYFYDRTGELNAYFSATRDKRFPELSLLNWLYVYRDTEKYDEDRLILAEVRRLSKHDRQVFGYDVAVEVDVNNWSESPDYLRYWLTYHEMLHVGIDWEDPETMTEPKTDKEGYVKFWILQHDIIVRKFREELLIFGITNEENDLRQLLNRSYHLHKRRTIEDMIEEGMFQAIVSKLNQPRGCRSLKSYLAEIERTQDLPIDPKLLLSAADQSRAVYKPSFWDEAKRLQKEGLS